jgi:hypothetical protein
MPYLLSARVHAPSNNAFDRTAGSHALAAAGQRERWTVGLMDGAPQLE